jgi:hypothetical protein
MVVWAAELGIPAVKQKGKVWDSTDEHANLIGKQQQIGNWPEINVGLLNQYRFQQKFGIFPGMEDSTWSNHDLTKKYCGFCQPVGFTGQNCGIHQWDHG